MKTEIRNTIVKAFSVLTGIGNSLQTPLLLAVRLYWGWQFAQNGWGKLHNIPHVTEFFMSLGIPVPGLNAWVVAIMEFVGGILLIVGIGSRLTSLALSVDMIVAYVAADRQALAAIFSDPGKFYNADPYTFLFASLLVFVFGPGKLALDFLLTRRVRALAMKSDISAAAWSLCEIPVAARGEADPDRRIS
jgi:putative oxidoreductase